jgi:glycosyltransferase involved in cell wall biosynthesis
MDPYFQRSRKQALVKKLYWSLSEKHNIAGARALFFTAQDEEAKARATYPLQGVLGVQVGYGIRDPQRPSTPPPIRSDLRLCFMSRIHPKKGLDVLIAALEKTPPGVSVDIWGTGDPQYTRRTQLLAKGLGDRVRWRGFVTGEDKWRALEDCDAMILPSRQENFGVIVAEAMSVSRPVLISREVNIWKEVEQDGGGLAAPCTPEGIAGMIERFRGLSSEERQRMSQAGRASFLSRFTIQASSAQFLRALEEAVK